MKHANMAHCDRKLYFRVVSLALVLSLVSGDCIDFDLGMEKANIPDNDITASSALPQAKNGRLNNAESWCADTADNNHPYLQIDLQTLHIICAVSTQGNSQEDQWVETYTLQVSTDGTTWTDYEEFGQVKILMGNNDSNTENKNIIYEGFLTRYLRFVGKTKHNKFCMRTEVFGVRQKPENIAVGKNTDQSSTFSDRFASGTSAKAVDGNPDIEFSNGHCSHTNNDNPSWWRVDLGSDNVPVYEVHIVNRFSQSDDIRQRSKNYIITLGNSQNVRDNLECVGRYSFIQYIASAVCYRVRGLLNTGRYLGIRTSGRQILQLCEVEVYSRENLAYNKATNQSSTGAGGNSHRAVDGKIITYYHSRSCTHTQTENSPWWRVDLGQVEPVSEVYVVNRGDCCGIRLSSFEIRVGPSSSNGGVTNPMCGAGGYSVSQGQGASFFCRPSLYGRYVTIRSTLNDMLVLCEVEVYSARRACQIQALGLASSYAFPDSRFSASSSRSNHEASKARLTGAGAWSPSTNGNSNDYLQVDLQHEFFICAVATQGNPNADDWTLKYKLLVSLNNADWVTYQENGADKILYGNDERNNIIKHNLVGVTRARFIRFQPTAFHNRKALRVEVYGILKPAGPSQAPTNFNMTPLTSTSVRASWQLPPANLMYGIILGFKLLYRNKSPASDPLTVITIRSNSTLTREVTGLGKYTEYEFQVLAFSSIGNGPRSVQVVTTNEGAPVAPTALSHTVIAPSESHGPRVNLKWNRPQQENGIIRSYNLLYSHTGDPSHIHTETFGPNTFSYSVDVLGGMTYQFYVRAVTIKPGTNASLVVVIPEYAPGAPTNLGHTVIAPSESHGPRVNLSWSRPQQDNGIIRGYNLMYSNSKDQERVYTQSFGPSIFSWSVDVFGGLTYQFYVRAVTVKPGENASSHVVIPEYVPSRGPENVSTTEVNYTTFRIAWISLPKEAGNGNIKIYQIKLILNKTCTVAQSPTYMTLNTTTTEVLMSSLSICTRYDVAVRAYTMAGPGPYSKSIAFQTLGLPWSNKEAPASPSFSTNLSVGGIIANIQLPRFPGNAKFFQVIVITIRPEYSGVINSSQSFTPQDLLTYEEAHRSSIPAAYITFQFAGSDFNKYQIFVLGSRTRKKRTLDFKEYENKPLQPNTNYRVFLRAFVTEAVYISSNFLEINIKDKPVVRQLPETITFGVGKLAILTCVVSGDPEPSVIWAKDGDTNIPRAQFQNNGRILVIQDVIPGDRGVYECKAWNMFGESRTATTMIVAVSPSIEEDASTPSVICEKYSLCILSCYAKSDYPVNYAWTKNGEIPEGDDVKIIKSTLTIRPRETKDYGVYVCNAMNSFGSTSYNITLSECPECSAAVNRIEGENNQQHILRAAVIALSSVVVLQLIVNAFFLWRQRRAMPDKTDRLNKRTTAADRGDSARDHHVSEPDVYMELHPRPSEGESRAPLEYQSLQGKNTVPEYYNVGVKRGDKAQNEEVYDEIGSAQA